MIHFTFCFIPEQSPEGIAIDPDEQFIFYTDGGLSTINLVTYDGMTHLQVVMNAKNPRAIETDRKNKYDSLILHLIQQLSGRTPDSQSRELGFESSHCYRFKVWAFSFSPWHLSSISCINEYLATDSDHV